MAFSVIITEKPSVAREYAKVLGISDKQDGYIEGVSKIDHKNYRITWAVGHLVTMSYPEKYDEALKKWSLDSLPFIPNKYLYETIPDVKKQFNVIKKLYNDSNVETIYYAGDSGREGIYIQMLIRQEAKVKNGVNEKVVWIDSQTEDEILRGLREAKPISAYDNLINAAYSRAIEDYLVGINFSRVLSCKFGYQYNKELGTDKYKPLSVGRVMTCVLGMIVRREREIRDFKETLFYRPIAVLSDFDAKWKAIEGTEYYNSPAVYNNEGFLEKIKADVFCTLLDANPVLTVEKTESKEEKKSAPLLYNLAEIQNECTKLFKISPDDTLNIIQTLYEAKLVTYPRTDARVLSTAVANEIDVNLKGLAKGNILSDAAQNVLNNNWHSGLSKTKYTNDSKITDHYAIIPTGETNTSSLSELQLKVYELIVKRFLAIFYPAAIYTKTELVLKHPKNEYFFVSEKILITPGYLKIYNNSEETTGNTAKLSNIKKGDTLNASFMVSEGKTNPPKRYTSGSMILAMENAGNLIEDEELRSQIKSCGIGTSATRAGIIKKLVDTGMIKLDKKSQILSPMLAGEKLYDIVEEHMATLLSPEMTASWEKGLSQIESGQITKAVYIDKLNTYVRNKVNEIKTATAETPVAFEPADTGLICPYCGNKIITTPNGYKCSKYSKEDGCSFYFGKISQRSFSIEELDKILRTGQSPVFNDFISKKGTRYSAFVTFDKNEKSFNLNFPENEESEYNCPKCNKPLIKNRWSLDCECGFKMSTSVAHKELSNKEIGELIMAKETVAEVKGLKKKDGKSFSAKLMRDDDGKISFVFDKKR